jgi:hypothetical protein
MKKPGNVDHLHGLFEQLQNHCLVLTPNHRIAVDLLEAYGDYRRSRAASLVCHTPGIQPVDIWIAGQWQTHTLLEQKLLPALLAPHHEFMLWLHAIRNVDIGINLLNQRATASAVRQAWSTLLQWRIPLSVLRHHGDARRSVDTQAFLAWQSHYAQACAEANVASLSEITELIISALANGSLKPPGKIILYGFTKPPPLYQALFETMISAGGEVQTWQVTKTPPDRLSKYRALTTDAELSAAARWAARLLADQPDARIAVICHGLPRLRSAIEHVFAHHLASAGHTAHEQTPPPDSPLVAESAWIGIQSSPQRLIFSI